MNPLLEVVSSGRKMSIASIRNALAEKFKLTEEAQRAMLPSGKQSVFHNRVGWAKTYLAKAKLISTPQRGVVQITKRGKEVLKSGDRIDRNYLEQFPEFFEFTRINVSNTSKKKLVTSNDDETPIERIEDSYARIKKELKEEVIELIMNCSPFFFEKLVVELLINLGYGGSGQEAGKAFSTSRDEGIDGVVKEDKLGLDLIYIQAKRWRADKRVGRPDIQKFAGALEGKRGQKGHFYYHFLLF